MKLEVEQYVPNGGVLPTSCREETRNHNTVCIFTWPDGGETELFPGDCIAAYNGQAHLLRYVHQKDL